MTTKWYETVGDIVAITAIALAVVGSVFLAIQVISELGS